MADSVSDRFSGIDLRTLEEELGSEKVDQIMIDIYNRDLSLKQVAERNNTSMGTVVQVARFHKIDPVTLEETE
jgi:predicted DNA-binding protein YlxM (UPF0122 family)